MNQNIRGHLALSVVALIYGANYVIAKSVMPEPIGANSFILLRVVGAGLLFWLVVNRKAVFPDRKDWGKILMCAITGVVVNQLFFFNGLALTSPVNASIIMTSNPIVVMLISAWFLKQRITLQKSVGVVLGAVGAVALLWISNQATVKESSLIGDIYILINSLSFAFYLVLVKPLVEKYSPILLTAWLFTIGSVVVIPFGGMGISTVEWTSLTPWQWFSVGYVIVFTTFMTYLLNNLAIRLTTSTVVSSYVYLQPVLATAFGFLLADITGKNLSADISWVKIVCALLIFLGVYLVGRSDRTVAKWSPRIE